MDAAEKKASYESMGIGTISMRDDFLTIYGEEVTKTGTFHWLEDLAEARVPAEPAEAPAAEEPAEEATEVPAA